MFKDVSTGNSRIQPGQYILRISRLEAFEHPEWGPRVRWIFNVYGMDKKALLDTDGSLYEFWQTTSNNMGPRAFARKYAEAFLGRSLKPGESGASLEAPLLGKTAIAIIGENERGYSTLLQILKREVATGGATPTPEERHPDPILFDADEIPFDAGTLSNVR